MDLLVRIRTLLHVARWRVSGVDGGVAFVVAVPDGSVASWADRCDELAQKGTSSTRIAGVHGATPRRSGTGRSAGIGRRTRSPGRPVQALRRGPFPRQRSAPHRAQQPGGRARRDAQWRAPRCDTGSWTQAAVTASLLATLSSSLSRRGFARCPVIGHYVRISDKYSVR